MQKILEYSFKYSERCNMCGSDSQYHKVLGRRLNRSQGKKPKGKIGISTTIVKCPECNLIYSNPLPIPKNIEDHYGIPPESYWKEEYFQLSDSYFQLEINKLKTLMKIETGNKSLDIGAGIGKSMTALERAGFNSYGIEPSEPFYNRAIERMGIKKDKIKLASAENAEFPVNYFDFITFSAVLEHLYDPSAAIEKAMGWLKPNGILHIEVPSSRWLINRIVNFYYGITGTDFVANLSPMHRPFHLYEFGLESFYKNSEKNKFEVASFEYFVCSTHLNKSFDFILKPYMEKTKTGMQLTVWLRKK